MTRSADVQSRAADHDEAFAQLVAARALGSIGPLDALQLQDHLAGCARCRQLLAEYCAVVDSLALSVPEAPEAPELKSRLLSEAARDLRGESGTAGELGSGRGGTRSLSSVRQLDRWPVLRRAYWLPLAAVLALSLWVGWSNVSLNEQLRQRQVQIERQNRFIAAVATGGHQVALAATDRAPGAVGEVVQPATGGPPLLVTHGLPDLPPSQVYQVWVIPPGGQPIGAGLMQTSGIPLPIIPLERDLAGVQTVALTIEPAGGSPGPTGPIVLAGRV